jgi:division protein CdvB (Snf7/Vps24/ESCRT-III family)
VLNPDYGDITDTDEGTDLVLNYGKPPGAQFPQTKLQPRRRPSPLSEDADTTTMYLNSIQEIMELFERKTSDEVEKLLEEFISGGVDAEGNSAETVQYTNKTDSVDNAFNELMNA